MSRTHFQVKVPEELVIHIRAYQIRHNLKTDSAVMLHMLTAFLGVGNHAQFSLPLPTESQRAGMRGKCLALLRSGKRLTPAEIGRVIGCKEAAASAYARDLRKGKHGGHNISSAPVMVDGQRTSVYWLEPPPC